MADEMQVRVAFLLDEGTDLHELDELGRRLRRSVSGLDVGEVSSVEAEAPEGARAGGVAAAGMFVVSLVKGAGGLGAIVAGARALLSRNSGRTIELSIDGDTIKVTAPSSEAQERLIDAWIQRHAAEAGE
jgi:hypothetical protein